MSITWYRSHHGAPSNTKLTIVARNSEQHRAFVTAVYWELYDYASCHEDRGSLDGLDHEVIAIQQDLDCHTVSRIVTEMSQRGIITSQNRLAVWEKEQVIREDDGAAARKRLQRQREKEEEEQRLRKLDDNESRHVTNMSHNVTLDTDKTRQDKSRIERKKERIEISSVETAPPVDSFPEDLDFKNIVVCFDVCSALLGQEKLSPQDAAALQAWHEIYDMRKVFVEIQHEMIKRLQRKAKPANSLRFFEFVLKRIPIHKPPDLEKLFA